MDFATLGIISKMSQLRTTFKKNLFWDHSCKSVIGFHKDKRGIFKLLREIKIFSYFEMENLNMDNWSSVLVNETLIKISTDPWKFRQIRFDQTSDY